ncbi:hypothetical protein SAMN05421831_11223 [Allopseudospirillum japonicum]|uniref:Uncharacterized protein n=1 Tax=Allopseudospirillum japonicum TaxID=64971 RepID=A0A1H6TU73_9GAMM|nr:hypothetical protein [Allopseudospirillum japonicum]SEI83571.1 hypothetical protein SAMN05421831_11223 [Allopseudospirillum japonicum]
MNVHQADTWDFNQTLPASMPPTTLPQVEPVELCLPAPEPLPLYTPAEPLWMSLDAWLQASAPLTQAQSQQADKLQTQIQTLWEQAPQGELSQAQLLELDTLNMELQALYTPLGWAGLSMQEQKDVFFVYQALASLPDFQAIHAERADLQELLDNIFGTPQTLDLQAQAQADALYAEIEAVMAVEETDVLLPEISLEQRQTLDVLYAQLDALYGVRTYENLTQEEQLQVDAIHARMQKLDDLLWGKPVEPEPWQPSEAAQAIYQQLDNIFGTQKQTLTADEQVQAEQIQQQIDALLLPDQEGKLFELTENQQEELDTWFQQLDALWGVRRYQDLSAEEQAQVDDLYQQLDTLYAQDDAPILMIEPWLSSPDLSAAYAQLEQIFGEPAQMLNPLEAQKAQQISEQIDLLLGVSSTEEGRPLIDVQAFNQFVDEYNTLYGLPSYQDLNTEQQVQVDEIYAQINIEVLDFYGVNYQLPMQEPSSVEKDSVILPIELEPLPAEWVQEDALVDTGMVEITGYVDSLMQDFSML